ncbi:MAG: hypothetical protein JOZ78_25285 [Chroococcidiopsidaceae cyanobacterium CP_BM_ER_R8_30]|nr:hypothetical protein [Chroococcidiopsidaceae cyanobacterium CP_BM_ER_R8_30]
MKTYYFSYALSYKDSAPLFGHMIRNVNGDLVTLEDVYETIEAIRNSKGIKGEDTVTCNIISWMEVDTTNN